MVGGDASATRITNHARFFHSEKTRERFSLKSFPSGEGGPLAVDEEIALRIDLQYDDLLIRLGQNH